MAHDNAIPDAIPFRTLGRPSGTTTLLLAALVLIGVIATVFSVMTGQYLRVWDSLLFNWLFWSSLAIGMVMFSVALHLTGANWAWSIRRFALGGVAFLPISLVILPFIFFGSEHYFHHWLPIVRGEIHDPIVEAKSGWLNLPFMIVRDIVGAAILYGLAIAFAYFSLRPDVYGMGARNGKAGLYARLTSNWRGIDEEVVRSRQKMTTLAPILAILYAVLWGMIGIDLAMTLEPHWFSTMFPVTFFWAGFHGGVAATAIAVTLVRRHLRLEDFITLRQYHDLGKLVFAFAVFWMYISWSQYIVIWYGLLPHEQEWFVHRFVDPFGPIVQVTIALIFLLPFFGLLMRPPKQVPGIVAFFSGTILLGYWLERFLLIVPSLWEGTGFPIGIPEIGMGLGFAGLFLAAYLWFLRSFPLLPSPASLALRSSNVVTMPADAVRT